jgi:hypothetical protein
MSRVVYLQGPSTLLNPNLDRGVIDAAYADDPEAARAEWGGLFRQDVTQYLDDATIDKALCPGERSRSRLAYDYVGFVDPAGGVAGGDEMTVAVAHSEIGGRVVLDQLLAIAPPFDTEKAVESCALVLKSFGVVSAKADKYAGLWPAQSFQRNGISLQPSELDKAGIYRECAPLFVSGLVSLIDDPRLEVQLRSLERTPKAGGRPDAIDHAPGRGSRDDRINAAAGALLAASKRPWLGQTAQGYARPAVHLRGTDYDPIMDPYDSVENRQRRREASEPIRDGWGRIVDPRDLQ